MSDDKAAFVLPRKMASWKKKLAFSILALVAFFGALELIFAGFGIRPFRETHDLFLDFEPGIPLFVRDSSRYVTNPLKLTYFNEQSFPVEKRPNSFRIFCLGGSTTYGRPYQDRFSYVRGLQGLLQLLVPDRDWQVINCGGISYSSYRLAALMEEIGQYQPDLVIFYEGHNEFLEERTYRSLRERPRWISSGIHAANHLRTTTVAHWLLSPWLPRPSGSRMKAEVNAILDNSVGPETYHRDLVLRGHVLEHFRASVDRICAMSHRSGARTILIQPASNLHDFSPFKSESTHSHQNVLEWNQHLRAGREALKAQNPAKALHELTQAFALDPLHAETQFLAGRAAFELSDFKTAQRHFVAAKDEDICPLRALSEVAAILEQVGHANGSVVIRFPEYVADRCRRQLGHDIPGNESFVDHVHPHPELHLELAGLLVREMVQMKLIPSHVLASIESAFQRESERMRQELSPSIKADALCTLAQELTWAGKILEALPISREAAELDPQNAWVICQYGRLLERTGDDDGAHAVYRNAVKFDPDEALGLERLGNFLLRRGELVEAAELLQRAVDHPADHAAPLSFRVGVRIRLGDCRLQMGDVSSARSLYFDALRLDSDSVLAKNRLARIASIR